VRQLFVLDYQGCQLVGTHHAPASGRAATGVLFLNFGYVPRDGHGLAVRACDELARRGFAGLRVDLPSLGDSEGDLPDDSQHWFRAMQAGEHAPVALWLVHELKRRFELDRVVLGGLCAAAVTAIFAAAAEPAGVDGLLLLEPEFYVVPDRGAVHGIPEASADQPSARRWATRIRRFAAGLFSHWSWMRIVTGESRYARMIPIPRSLLVRALRLQQTKLPTLTNLPLVAAWQSVVRSGCATLVVSAKGKTREHFFDQVNAIAVPSYERRLGLGRRIEHARVPNTNHIFTTGTGKEAVAQAIADWVARHFT
jgi:hypothetical protein